MKTKEMDCIEIEWEGPCFLKDVRETKNDPNVDCGLYQIYGDHAIYGLDVLLYIGKTEEQTFGQRFTQHSNWLPYEQSNAKIYLGRLGKDETDNKWKKMVNQAERLLIYYCAPSYNSSGIVDYGNLSNLILLNYGNKAMLPYELSTLYEESEYAKKLNKKFFWELEGMDK